MLRTVLYQAIVFGRDGAGAGAGTGAGAGEDEGGYDCADDWAHPGVPNGS